VDLDITSSQVLMAMSTEDSVLFSEPTLNSFGAYLPAIDQYFPVRRHRIPRQEKMRLREELQEGKCVIGLGEDGQLLRTVLVCVLEVANSAGEQFVRIASSKNGTLAPDCVLPGTKLRGLETAQQAFERLLHCELPKLVGTCFVEQVSEETTVSVVKRGINNAYLMTKFIARFDEDACFDEDADNTARNVSVSSGMFTEGCPNVPQFDAIESHRPDGRIDLYAWMSMQDFEVLRTHAAGKEFLQWLAAYDDYLRQKSSEMVAGSVTEESSSSEVCATSSKFDDELVSL